MQRRVNFCLSVHAIATIQPIIPHDARRCRKIGTPLAAERTSRRPADCLDRLGYTLIPHPSAPPPLASLHFFLSCLLHPPALLLPVSADRQDALTNCNKMCIQCTQPFFLRMYLPTQFTNKNNNDSNNNSNNNNDTNNKGLYLSSYTGEEGDEH